MVTNFKNKKKKKGFTLIELIIVIAIIAILAAIAIPKFVDVRNSAATKTDVANAKTIATAAATLYAEGSVVNDEAGKEVVKAAANTDENSKTNGNKIADYLQEVPTTKLAHGTAAAKSNFFVVIDNGTVTVYAGSKDAGNILYPAGALAE